MLIFFVILAKPSREQRTFAAYFSSDLHKLSSYRNTEALSRHTNINYIYNVETFKTKISILTSGCEDHGQHLEV